MKSIASLNQHEVGFIQNRSIFLDETGECFVKRDDNYSPVRSEDYKFMIQRSGETLNGLASDFDKQNNFATITIKDLETGDYIRIEDTNMPYLSKGFFNPVPASS